MRLSLTGNGYRVLNSGQSFRCEEINVMVDPALSLRVYLIDQ